MLIIKKMKKMKKRKNNHVFFEKFREISVELNDIEAIRKQLTLLMRH